jgi:hypothetical protein
MCEIVSFIVILVNVGLLLLNGRNLRVLRRMHKQSSATLMRIEILKAKLQDDCNEFKELIKLEHPRG